MTLLNMKKWKRPLGDNLSFFTLVSFGDRSKKIKINKRGDGMDTTLMSDSFESLQKSFLEYQEALEKKFDGNSYTSHQDADYLYVSDCLDRNGAQSYTVGSMEFFLKATPKQLQLFQNYFRDVVQGNNPEVEYSPIY